MKPIRFLVPYSEQPRIEPISQLVPRILLTWKVLKKTIRFLEFSCGRNEEFSWVGKVKKVVYDCSNKESYLIEDIVALKQNNSAMKTEIDVVSLGRVAERWVRESDGKTNPLKFWGHSHLFESTEPSSRDNDQMDDLIRGVATPIFFIRGIFSPQDTNYNLQTKNSRHPSFANVNATDRCPAFQAEFTLFDYQKGIAVRNVPWRLVDEYDEWELEELLLPSSDENFSGQRLDFPVVSNTEHFDEHALAREGKKKKGAPPDDSSQH
jgi:hypothetical protein